MRTGRILIFSPIPPMKTGTANYISLILDELLKYDALRDRISIIIDSDFLPAPVSEFRRLEVRDYRTEPSFIDRSDIAFLFLANNEYHGYIARFLSMLSASDRERVVTIVHEPCTFMLLNKLSGDGIQTFSRTEQLSCLDTQHGVKSRKLLDDLNAGHLPRAVEFYSIGIDYHLWKSSEVWCHSAYAISKLILESDVAAEALPRFRLVSHPLYQLEYSAAAERRLEHEKSLKKGFRAGLFGWCSPSKMIIEFLQGFALFLDRRTASELEDIELIIVGQMHPDTDYPIRGEISRLDLTDFVRTYDYVDDQSFAALVRTCDLIGNLRYPSCGETSGTLSHAHASGSQIITSRYQSFAEEVADYRLPANQALQPMLVSAALERSWLRRASGGGRPSASGEYQSTMAPMLPAGADKLMALRCAQFLAAQF